MMAQMMAIAAGGAVGALLRWFVAGSVQRLAGGAFPWGTFAVNAIGSFLIGFLFVFMVERSSAGELWRLGVTVGLLGALTTFSTFSLESLRLLQTGAVTMALANILGQIVVCLSLTWLGIQLARTL
jgi:fluoride exporter